MKVEGTMTEADRALVVRAVVEKRLRQQEASARLALYSDRYSVFRVNRKDSGEVPTHFTGDLRDLPRSLPPTRGAH